MDISELAETISKLADENAALRAEMVKRDGEYRERTGEYIRACNEITALRGEVARLESVSERLDKKLAEEYVKTMKLEATLTRYREAVEEQPCECHDEYGKPLGVPCWRCQTLGVGGPRAGEGE